MLASLACSAIKIGMQKITIYTMDYCPFCERVKKLFQSKGYAYEEKKLSMDDDTSWALLEAKTKYKTMPQVFIGDQFYGGYNDIVILDEKGDLDRIIEGRGSQS